MWIKIYDRSGVTLLSKPDNFENLKTDTCSPGGFTTASFVIHRVVDQFWEDMQSFNHVEIGEGPDIIWEGYIAPPEKSIMPDTFTVNCLGWSSRLNETGTEDDITAGVGGYQANEYITDVLLADTYLNIVAGDIDTNDFVFPQTCRFEFSPYTTHFDAMEQLNECNRYDWGIWENKKISWQPKSSTVDWFVTVDDCNNDLRIAENPAAFCNRVLVRYTQGSVHEQTVYDEDTDSQEKYGRTVIKQITLPGRVTTATAEQRAAEYLNECSTLRTAAEFTTKRVYDACGAEHHLSEVRAGDVVRLIPWLPTEEELGIDDIATFQIKSTSYDHDGYSLSITPTEFLPSIEIFMARLQAVGY